MTARQQIGGVALAGLALALLLTAFLNVAILVVPIYDMQLYDRVLMSRNMDTLTVLSVACGIGLLLYFLVESLRSACFVAIGQIIARRLNGPVLEESIRRAASGDPQAGPQLARDVNELQSFVASGAIAVPFDALCAPLFLVVLFLLHPAFGFLAIAGIAALVFANAILEYLASPALLRAHAGRRAADEILSRSLAEPEFTAGLGMLPAIGQRWAARRGSALAELNRAASRQHALTGLSRLARFALQTGVMALGSVLIIAGATTPGSLMGANLLLNKLMGPFDHLVGSWKHWVTAYAAWQRIRRSLPNKLLTPSRAIAPRLSGAAVPGLTVSDAELRLPDGRMLLHRINFRLAPGTLAVLAGPNGAGKSSLLRLLAGALAPSSGAVLLDGVPVQGGPEIGYLPQGVHLLDGTVAENIGRFQPERTAVVDAARAASVHEPIGRMARGYDTSLVRDGSNLSGGMRQRVGLARALFGAPRLLVFDEPDASLDGEGSAALLRALRARCAAGAIAIVASHRPALREAADRVLELRDGRLLTSEGVSEQAA